MGEEEPSPGAQQCPVPSNAPIIGKQFMGGGGENPLPLMILASVALVLGICRTNSKQVQE